jgi:SAM-dependent methyltransferase
VAARYAAYRPHYPAALVDALAARCTRHDLAWDAGCGSGQLSVALAARFARVIATDPSQAQLDAAEHHPRVEYRRGAAEDGVDVVCDVAIAAQAAHWFDWPRFVAAVERATRPGALVGVVSYGRVVLAGEAGAVLDAFYDDTIAPYWPPERAHVHDHYAALRWPWPAVAAPAVAMTEAWTRDELLGYVSTWSAVARFVAANGTAAVDALAAHLATVWPDAERRAIAWPLTVKLARR